MDVSPPSPSAAAPLQAPALRVLHLTAGADAGGLTQYITTLGTAMTAWGHHVAAAGDDGAWRWAFEAAPFPYVQIPLKGGPLAMHQCVRTLRRWLAEHPVDLIHAHYRRGTLLGRRLQRALPNRPPLLYTLHLSHIRVGGWRRWLTDFGDHTHVASQDALDWITTEARRPAQRVTLIPHGIDTQRYPHRTDADRLAARQRLGLPADATIAAYVGRLDDPKNEDWCLDLLTQAVPPLPNLYVLFAGEGPHEPGLRDLIARHGLSKRARLLGHIDPLPVYQAADVLLLPSAREGFSLVCAEAMSVGLPHVRTRTSGHSELTLENVTGLGVPIDRDAFLQAATTMLAQPSQRLREMGENAARYIRERFSFERQLDQTLALYRRLVGQPVAHSKAPAEISG